jgi:hypothetical protein
VVDGSTGNSRLNGFLVDRTVARRSAVGCTELARAFLASKAIARRIHASFPVSSMGQRDGLFYARLYVRQARRTLVDTPNSKPWLPTAVSVDPNTYFAAEAFGHRRKDKGTYFEVECSIGARTGVGAENWLEATEFAFPALMQGIGVESHHIAGPA